MKKKPKKDRKKSLPARFDTASNVYLSDDSSPSASQDIAHAENVDDDDDDVDLLQEKSGRELNVDSLEDARLMEDAHARRAPTPTPSLRLLPMYDRTNDTFTTEEFEEMNVRHWKERLRDRLHCHPLRCFYKTVPVAKWLPRYRWKDDIFFDILSGITVGIMHIPQGMAYGLLGNVPPVVGMYMGFFPVLAYFVFGTSRHVSIGTFAIVCLMTGKVVSRHASAEVLTNGTVVSFATLDHGGGHHYTNLEVVSTVTFCTALIMFAMYAFRLGVLTNLLCDTLVSGFTCACAFHVVASQIKDLFDFHLEKRRGYFSVLFTLYDSALEVPQANRIAVGVSLTSIVIMVINNEIIKPRLAKKTRVPLPIELLVVIMGTSVSYLLDFEQKNGISVIGSIPTGMPTPQLPVIALIPDIFLDCLVIAIISYAITMSMALIFSTKSQYKIDSNQELLAMSCANMVGSLFWCMPIAASLSRSTIQHTIGGVSQLASIVSCCILFVVLMWIGPLFQQLPKCVLASIIVVALKSVLLQCKQLPNYWRMSKWDGGIWLVTFFMTLLISIAVGLLSGIIMCLFSIFFQGQVPYASLLGSVPNTDIYLDVRLFKKAAELPGIKIFSYSGSLNFATKQTFKDTLYKTVRFSRRQVERGGGRSKSSPPPPGSATPSLADEVPLKCVIVDCSAITYVDPAGVEQLLLIAADLRKAGIDFYIAHCKAPIYRTFTACEKIKKIEGNIHIFPRVHDAVMYAKLMFFSTDL